MDDRLRGPSLASMFLRIGLGLFSVIEGWSRMSDFHALISLWRELHFPGPAVLGPGLEIAKVCGGMLLLVGLLTRFVGLFLALAAFGEILTAKVPLKDFAGWMAEWQSIWMALALLVLGAGSVSLDGFIRGRVRQPRWPFLSPSNEAYAGDFANTRTHRPIARRR